MAAHDIPRQLIPWYPTVDSSICTGDQECFNFCKNDVFEWDEAGNHPIIKNPYNCVVGCQACVTICPVQAITFPTKEELRETLRSLRSQLSQPVQIK